MSHVSPTSDLKQARATYSVRVLAVRMITPTIRAVRVEKPAEFVFRASQAARIFLRAPHDLEPHPISMASAPTRNYLEFVVRRSESAWKQSYFAVREGDVLQIQGPVARFFLDTTRPALEGLEGADVDRVGRARYVDFADECAEVEPGYRRIAVGHHPECGTCAARRKAGRV